MADECFIKFLRKTKPDEFFPPTDLYNEGWMLRLILDWFHQNPQSTHKFGFNNGATWYSEGLLPTAFCGGGKPRETRTHADGVIGHITIEEKTKAGLKLREDASQFVVIEAKMFSGLSKGVKHAPYFNQVARTVACMAEAVKRAPICPSTLQDIAFYVVAPESQIEKGIFRKFMNKDHIKQIVKCRISKYPSKRLWFDEWFLPTHQEIEVSVISWENILKFISGKDASEGKALQEFYDKCFEFNKRAA